MVSVIDAYYGLSNLAIYELGRFKPVIDLYFNLGQYTPFDCSCLKDKVSAGYEIDGLTVYFNKTFLPLSSIMMPDKIDLYYNELEEIVNDFNGTEQFFIMGYFDQEDIEIAIKESISESNLFRVAYIDVNTWVNYGASISKNYEQFLKVINSTRYRNEGVSSDNYLVTWNKFIDFTIYDESGLVIDEGVRVPQGSGSGLNFPNRALNSEVNKQGSLGIYLYSVLSVYYDITVTRGEDEVFIEEVNAIYQRTQDYVDGVGYYVESYSLKFDISNGDSALELRAQEEVVNGGEVGTYQQVYYSQRRIQKHVETTDINHAMSLTGVSAPP